MPLVELFTIFNAGAVPVQLMLALCTVESGLNPIAVNQYDGNSASYGLCQIKLETAKRFIPKITAKALLRPAFNVVAATKYLRHQYNRYGDWRMAIAAYNSGTVKYNQYGKLVNRNYVQKVEALWHKYQIGRH